MRSEEKVNQAIERYADTVRRICMVHLKNESDTEDIFQTVFLKYALFPRAFQSGEHEKAWMIRVTINACRDLLKSVFRSRTVSLDVLAEQPGELDEEHREVLEAVLDLPPKYKNVVYLHYYEGYTAAEIGQILKKNVNSVYTLLTRARKLLKEKLVIHNNIPRLELITEFSKMDFLVNINNATSNQIPSKLIDYT